MLVELDLPKAFSVREENEFFPFMHLMAAINPMLMVAQVATGRHINGGCTVLWGLVYLQGQPLSEKQAQAALIAAGFDIIHGTMLDLDFVTEPERATADETLSACSPPSADASARGAAVGSRD